MCPLFAPPAAGTMYPILGGGEFIYSPHAAQNNNFTLASGTMVLAYGMATRTESVGHIAAPTGTAAVTATYCAYGLFTVDASGNLTRVAVTASNTSLWSSAFQGYAGIQVNQALLAPYVKQAGQLYAVGALFVGTTAPQLVGAGMFGGATSPAAAGLQGSLTAQAAIPASALVGALTVPGNGPPCFALLP